MEACFLSGTDEETIYPYHKEFILTLYLNIWKINFFINLNTSENFYYYYYYYYYYYNSI